MPLMFPCPSCGAPVNEPGRCPTCSTTANRSRRRRKPHHHAPESRRARAAVRAEWVAQAERTRVALECARCGGPIDHELAYPAPGSLMVGHRVAGVNEAGYQPEHKRCGEAAGAD